MYRFFSLLFLLIGLSFVKLQAQDTFAQDSAAIHAVVTQLFDGMRKGDSAMVHATMHPEVRMLTSYINKEGEAKLQVGSLDRFLQAVGTPHEAVWNETIDALHVEVDDNLAHAWVDYSFYVNEDFHHCGVDAFLFIREGEENWKIIHLADTRRTEGCL